MMLPNSDCTWPSLPTTDSSTSCYFRPWAVAPASSDQMLHSRLHTACPEVYWQGAWWLLLVRADQKNTRPHKNTGQCRRMNSTMAASQETRVPGWLRRPFATKQGMGCEGAGGLAGGGGRHRGDDTRRVGVLNFHTYRTGSVWLWRAVQRCLSLFAWPPSGLDCLLWQITRVDKCGMAAGLDLRLMYNGFVVKGEAHAYLACPTTTCSQTLLDPTYIVCHCLVCFPPAWLLFTSIGHASFLEPHQLGTMPLSFPLSSRCL